MMERGDKPNILLIMCDQLRASALGCYGNSVVKTPWIDSLARDGVVFDRAYTQTPVCVPARLWPSGGNESLQNEFVGK